MDQDLYTRVAVKAAEIEAELKSLNRWDDQPLPEEKFVDMGAFGSRTMAFEQWVQFILLPRINEIVWEKGTFPANSKVATYAIRNSDGDPSAERMCDLLFELDELINVTAQGEPPPFKPQAPEDRNPVADIGTLTNIFTMFDGDALESHLETLDNFLSVLDPRNRPAVSELLHQASLKMTNEESRIRVQKAAGNVLRGEMVSEPYDHEAAMKKYMEEFKRSFPGSLP